MSPPTSSSRSGREDEHEKGKPRHMSTSPAPVIEYVASVSAITYTALSPVTEYVAPAPVVTYAAASWDIDYVSHSN